MPLPEKEDPVLKSQRTVLSRRQFVTKVVPACALTCLAGRPILALAQSDEAAEEEVKHKFDRDSGRKLTNRQLLANQYKEFIDLSKALSEEMGTEKFLKFLLDYTEKKGLAIGEWHASNSPDTRFTTYVNTFKDPRYDVSLTMEILEDTDTVFEIKVTECLWASVFREADAGEIGYAAVCYGDYSWARGFNPKIEMVRDQTLMQGHACCNHRYLWKG
jgi:hypothetical protein